MSSKVRTARRGRQTHWTAGRAPVCLRTPAGCIYIWEIKNSWPRRCVHAPRVGASVQKPTQLPAVAITGLGLVSPLGLSVTESVKNALRGISGIRPYRGLWSDGGPEELVNRVGGTVEGFDPTRFISAKFAAR